MHSKNSKKSKNTDKKSISNYDQTPMIRVNLLII